MMKRIVTALFAGIIIFSTLPAASAASATGFLRVGGYSSGDPAFTFAVEEAVLMHNGESYYDPDYGEIWAGSELYIPIYCSDDRGDSNYDDIATMAQVNESKVEVSYKAGPDEKFIKKVSIVDGSSAKSKHLEAGAHAKIEFSDAFGGPSGTAISLQIVLSVNKVTEQDTRASMRGRFINRTEQIKNDSVYSAQIPTAFRSKVYTGEATFDFGKGIRFTGKVKKDGYYYMKLNRDGIEAIKDKYKKVHMEFYQFEGDYKSFESTGKLLIPVEVDAFRPKKKEAPQIYVYEINGETLTALDERQLSFQKSNNTITLRTAKLGSYVLSSQPLMKDVEQERGILHTGYAKDENSEPVTQKTAAEPPPEPTLPQALVTPVDQPIAKTEPEGTGQQIYADNKGTINPSTGDYSIPGIAGAGMAIGLAAMFMLFKGMATKK